MCGERNPEEKKDKMNNDKGFLFDALDDSSDTEVQDYDALLDELNRKMALKALKVETDESNCPF